MAHAGTMDAMLMPGQVINGHLKYESDCSNCHKQFDKAAQSGLCKDCHKDITRDIESQHGFHGRIKEQKACRECHTEHKGREARIVHLDARGFDHLAQTGFELKGGHLNEKVMCKDCHSPLKRYRDAPTKCFGCHERADKHKGGLGKDCENCHIEKDWKTTHYDHSKTHFPLLGKHLDVKCSKCHINEQYKDTPMACYSCHKRDDKHKGSFGQKCETCHVERDWKEILFDHGKKTKFALLGKHMSPPVKCTACHKGDLYQDKLQMTCVSCHKKEDEKAHKGRFGPKCESCHNERGWKDQIKFDHDKTKFPLLDKHRDLKCNVCHKGDLYKDKLQMTCVSCHKKDDSKAHKGSFGDKCESCHSAKGWKEILFDHDKKTKFPLLGKHMSPPVKCTACHKGDLYKDKLKTDCYSCHQKEDKHKGQEGRKCETCHHEQSWKKTDFDHRMSRFPLTGRHLLVECKKCHLSPAFKDAKSTCWACHAKRDVHKRGLGTNCEKCHNTRDWRDWDFDHDKTGFKLTGKHKTIRCVECHRTPVAGAVALAGRCVDCHSKDDKHDGAFGERCERCHVGMTWKELKVGSKTWVNR